MNVESSQALEALRVDHQQQQRCRRLVFQTWSWGAWRSWTGAEGRDLSAVFPLQGFWWFLSLILYNVNKMFPPGLQDSPLLPGFRHMRTRDFIAQHNFHDQLFCDFCGLSLSNCCYGHWTHQLRCVHWEEKKVCESVCLLIFWSLSFKNKLFQTQCKWTCEKN